jgi:hypothetical protein
MTNEIDWSNVLSSSEAVSLREVPIGDEVQVSFTRVFEADGKLGAEVACDLPGDVLWLKGQYGPQNGLLSLMKAAEGGENIEGQSFVFTRIESENSPAGYAFRWDKAEDNA